MAARSSGNLFRACSLICAGALAAVAVCTQEPPTPTNPVANATNDALPALLKQQRDSIHQAIEELRQEVTTSSKQILDKTTRDAEALSQKVNDTLSTRLELIERGLTQRHERELEALRDSNKTFLTVAGLFAGLGFLGIVVAAAILARALNRFSEVAMSIPTGRTLVDHGPERGAIGAGELRTGPAQFEQASGRFVEAMERLEKRIKELELSGHTGLSIGDPAHLGDGDHGGTAKSTNPENHAAAVLPANQGHDTATGPMSAAAGDVRADVSVLLGKGQALLNLGQTEEAIECLNKAIALDPKNADAFVKKGMAMERLQRMEEAIENYDRAIAVNDSLTLAYLYKGAVCNKLQRFREALECYEKALKSEQKSVAA